MKNTRTISNRTANEAIGRADNRKVSPLIKLAASIEKEHSLVLARRDHNSIKRWLKASRDYHYLTGTKHRLSAPIEVK